jgi:hypothetical protein
MIQTLSFWSSLADSNPLKIHPVAHAPENEKHQIYFVIEKSNMVYFGLGCPLTEGWDKVIGCTNFAKHTEYCVMTNFVMIGCYFLSSPNIIFL